MVVDDEFHSIRIRSRLHAYVTRWSYHWSFGGSIMSCILFNSITLAVETAQDSISVDAYNALKNLDNFFLAVYMFEFLVKMYVSPTAYFTSSFCLFDFLVLILSWVDLICSLTITNAGASLSGFRVLRILRTLRALRTISFFPSMQVIVTALMTTIRVYMLNLMVVLFLIIFIFGVMAYYLYASPTNKFMDLGSSMLAMASFVTLDNWNEIEQEIDNSPAPLPARWFCVIFIFIGNYVYTNVFVSVVIVNLNDAQQDYIDADRAKRREIVAEKTITMNQKQKDEAASFQLFLQQDQRAKFANYTELLKLVKQLLSSLERSDEEILCGDTSLNLLFVQEYLGIVDQVDNETYMQRNLYRELGNLLSLAVERQLETSGLGERLLRENTIRIDINNSKMLVKR